MVAKKKSTGKRVTVKVTGTVVAAKKTRKRKK